MDEIDKKILTIIQINATIPSIKIFQKKLGYLPLLVGIELKKWKKKKL